MGVCFRIYWEEQQNICFEFSMQTNKQEFRDIISSLSIEHFVEIFHFYSCVIEEEEEIQRVFSSLRGMIGDDLSFSKKPSRISIRKA